MGDRDAVGAILLVRGEAWEDVGGFDERIYMYAEDLDLCWRAGRAGWNVWFCAKGEFTSGNIFGRKGLERPEAR